MPVWKRQWQELCQRLGVQPQQFAVLIAVTVVGVGVLTLKSAFGPRTAGAAASTSAKSAASDKTASSAAQSRSETTTPVAKAAVVASTSAGAAPSASRHVVEMAFERAPARDPFKAWNVPEPVPETVPARALVRSEAIPGVLPGLPLKAVVRGELAVFGDQTVRVGDAVGLPDGTFARIKAIGDRTVTVDHDGQLIDVQFGAGIAGKAPAAGGFR
jgi:hypothetical protein